MKLFFLTLGASVLLMGGARGTEADYHLGEWIGTWNNGGTSGHFNLALERAPDGTVTGNVDIVADGGKTESEFAVDLRQITFDGDQMTAVFVTPEKDQKYIKMTGLLQQNVGHGEWVAHTAIDSGKEMLSGTGTWAVQKYVP